MMKATLKNVRLLLCTLMLLFIAAPAVHAAGHGSEDGKVDVKSIIFGHVGDTYDWHITDIGSHKIAIDLPIIVYSRTSGWHVFSYSKIAPEEGAAEAQPKVYEGFHIAKGGDLDGKVVENVNGTEVQPFDMSITKNTLALFINSLITICVVLGVARWYKHRKVDDPAPKGFVGGFEMFTMWIHDDVIKSSIGKGYEKFAPYLLTVFYFILINNVMGLLPIFPGGASVTGNIGITFVLALLTFLITNLSGTKHYWKDIFWPDVPTWLKCPVPMMPLIEFFGIFTKPFALMVRLFANMLAGHCIILSLICIIFITAKMGVGICAGLSTVSVLMTIFMDFLEVLVAFLQAYVFTMLSAVFIGLAHEHKEA